jgi:type IV pilus assembly protein PilC
MGLYSSQLSTKKLVPLCRQLATAYDAGIPILRSLEIISEQQRDKKVKDVLARMGNAISAGGTLGEAARAEQKYLSTFFIELLSTGERGGKLDVMLNDLADYYEDRLEMTRGVRRMMTLPCIQLVAAWFLGSFSLLLVGEITNMFSDKSGKAFALGAFFNSYGRFQAKAMAVVAVVLILSVILSRAGLSGWIWSFFTTHIWPLSGVTRKFALSRFFRSFSLLVGGGMHFPWAIESSAAVTSNPYIAKDLMKAIPAIKDGKTLVEAFAPCKYLTPTAREMILIGEQSGDLEGSLHKVADYHMKEASHAVNVATKIFGVLIVLAVALTIGYIIITFYQRLYGGMMDGLGI